MAFSYTLVRRTADTALFLVYATADADTGGDVLHGLGISPDLVVMTPICTTCRLALWTSVPGGIDATKVTLSKTVLVGSSNPLNPVLRLYVAVAGGRTR